MLLWTPGRAGLIRACLQDIVFAPFLERIVSSILYYKGMVVRGKGYVLALASLHWRSRIRTVQCTACSVPCVCLQACLLPGCGCLWQAALANVLLSTELTELLHKNSARLLQAVAGSRALV